MGVVASPAGTIRRGSSGPWSLRLAPAELGATALTLTGVEVALFVRGGTRVLAEVPCAS